MRRSFWFSILLLPFALLLPHLTYAATTNFFGPIVSSACNCPGGAAAWGCVMGTLQALMNTAVSLGVVLITIFIAWAGVAYLMAPISAEGRNKAKQRLLNAVLGLLIMLGAWLLVDSIMKVIYNGNSAQFGPWNSILVANGAASCITPTSPAANLPAINSPNNVTGGTPTTASSPTSGRCTAPSSGPCSVANLSNTCFGSNAATAAEYCNKESGDNANSVSKTDKTADGYSYSVGLFQTNLTNSFNSVTVDGQQCSKAFSVPCQGSNLINQQGACSATVTNLSLYNDCVAAAENPTTETQAACSLSSDGSSWSHWRVRNPATGQLAPECSF